MKQTAKDRAEIIKKNEKELAALMKNPDMRRRAELAAAFEEDTTPRFELPDGAKKPNVIDYGASSGEPIGRPKQPLLDRFFSSMKQDDGPKGCWTWLLAGRFTVGTIGSKRRGGKDIAVPPRAFAWEHVFKTKPPPRLYPQCQNGRCIRPEHMGPKQPPRIGNTRFMVENPMEKRKRLIDRTAEPTFNDLRARAATLRARIELAERRGDKTMRTKAEAELARMPATETLTPLTDAPSIVPEKSPLASTDASSALINVVRILDALDAAGRARVIAAVQAFYPAA